MPAPARALTGTPVQNNVNELLSLLSFMLPATFPPELALAFADASSSRARLSDAEVGRLRRLLAPFILRRLKAHVLTQLVPKVEEEALVEMSPRQRLVYEKILRAHAKARKQRDGGGRDAPPRRGAPRRRRRRRRRRRQGRGAVEPRAQGALLELREGGDHACPPRLGLSGERGALGSLYTDAQVGQIAAAAHATETFGRSASLAMVRAELVEFSDWELHALCADVPALRKLQLPPPKLYDSGKLARLAELLPKLHAEGHRVLLFSQSTQTLDLLEEFVSAPRDAGGPASRTSPRRQHGGGRAAGADRRLQPRGLRCLLLPALDAPAARGSTSPAPTR